MKLRTLRLNGQGATYALATLAALGLIGGIAAIGGNSVEEAAALDSGNTSASSTVPAGYEGGTATHGQAPTKNPPNAEQQDRASQIHFRITNSTGETLKLVSKSHGGGSVHWEAQPHDLAPNETETINVYAAVEASITVQYEGETSHTMFYLDGANPPIDYNEGDGWTDNPAYQVLMTIPGGYDGTWTFDLQLGQSFAYTGHPETYTVPPGVTKLAVTAEGGTGGYPYLSLGEWQNYVQTVRPTPPTGALLKGTISVAPGDVLTVGVGGNGGDGVVTGTQGGWGMQSSSGDYAGGSGLGNGTDHAAGGGGGATVIFSAEAGLVLAAGGGGGSYGTDLRTCPHQGVLDAWYPNGGKGGDGVGDNTQPTWLGHPGEWGVGDCNDQPDFHTGGKSGGWQGLDPSSHGQNATAATGGAGGGGFAGGQAGPKPATGGGAGSSFAAPWDMAAVTVTSASAQGWDKHSEMGYVTLSLPGTS